MKVYLFGVGLWILWNRLNDITVYNSSWKVKNVYF